MMGECIEPVSGDPIRVISAVAAACYTGCFPSRFLWFWKKKMYVIKTYDNIIYYNRIIG